MARKGKAAIDPETKMAPEDGTQAKVNRNQESASAWRTSGRNVMKDYCSSIDEDAVKLWNGYNRVWEEDTQEVAYKEHENGKLFFKGMSGGVSDIESNLQFIPIPGRKKIKPAQEVVQEEFEMEEGETTECSENMSEYSSDECPDIDDSDDDLAEFMGDCTLGDDEAQITPVTLSCNIEGY
eukprot:jgi/Picsp_1/3493/NSC_06331-R1_---NA---